MQEANPVGNFALPYGETLDLPAAVRLQLRPDRVERVTLANAWARERAADIVICDNLATHKVKGVQHTIQEAGATLLYLPAYSPDLNPIELAFAKLKASLRHAAQRTFQGLLDALASTLPSFSHSHCLNFFRHSHYATD